MRCLRTTGNGPVYKETERRFGQLPWPAAQVLRIPAVVERCAVERFHFGRHENGRDAVKPVSAESRAVRGIDATWQSP